MTRRRLNNAHGHDLTRWLSKLLAESSVCHWCGRPVARVKDLKREGLEVLGDTHFDVTWKTAEGERVTRSKATLDHIVPMSRGGARKRENVVIACARCNHRRNVEAQPRQFGRAAFRREVPPSERWRERHPTPDDDRELGDPGA